MELPVGAAEGSLDVVKIEIDQADDGLVKVARPGQVVVRATRSPSDMSSGIRPVAWNVVDGFRGMARAPDEISVESGLSLSAEVDAVISSTSAEANFKVSLTWHRTAPSEGHATPSAS
ncbi:CU044_2847 family protein [Kitasatospora sp. NPDC088779]|uniref:CU044_2847 family protein n=1 Tax=Kitasatospora sp. NPDC088779 TaxID=3154964 RepID=UPI003424644D